MRKSRENRGGESKKARREGKTVANPRQKAMNTKTTCIYIGLWARDSLIDRKAIVFLRAGSLALT
jgi:hypothetical protein